MARLRVAALTRTVLSPPAPGREPTLKLVEGLGAVAHLIASLEYLAQEHERQPGGVNDWSVTGARFTVKSRTLRRLVNAASEPQVTRALHVARVAAAAALLGPTRGRQRLLANAVLSASSFVLYPRHHYGTDGSDQAAFLVQTAATVARTSRRPQLVDACLWYVGSQAVLSYAVSGWAKLPNRAWRRGEVLPGIMRTATYGDRQVYELVRKYPRTSRALGAGVLAMECLFPAVFLARGRLTALFSASALSFHVVNARVMGLNRFVWAFAAMHPAVFYVTGPREDRGRDGGERRDDFMPAVLVGAGAAALATMALAHVRRRQAVRRGRGDERMLAMSSGNTLAYRRTGPDDAGAPLVVLVHALAATADYWEWIASGLADRYPTVTYQRAGYGPSIHAARQDRGLDTAVDDLVELARELAGDRPVVLMGHSLGGYLALRAAERLEGTVQGVVLVDTSHPAELTRSKLQGQGREILDLGLENTLSALRMGLGTMMREPENFQRLPDSVRGLISAQYRDAGLWTAAHREWEATKEAFEACDGRLPHIGVPLLVLTAGFTAKQDETQLELHEEIADAAPRAERHVLAGTDHDGILSEAKAAGRVVDLVTEFVGGLDPQGGQAGQVTAVDRNQGEVSIDGKRAS